MNIQIVSKTGKKEEINDFNLIKNRDDIKLLEITNYNFKNIIINSGIETLIIKKSLLTEFPDISRSINTIRTIYIKTAKIEKIPDLSKYTELEELTVEDAYIEDINYHFPTNLRNLNLSYNKLSDSFFYDLERFPNDLVSINISHNFITKVPPISIRSIVNYECNNIEEKKICTVLIDDVFQTNRPNYIQNQYVQQIYKPEVTMFNNSQTVHITSINDSASKSIKNILDKVQNYAVNNKYFDEILREFYGPFVFRCWYYPIKIASLKSLINDTSVHSVMKVTYAELLERVWTLISYHPQKKNLIERLKTEIHESFGYCFTGRINRLINSLSGFVDGIGITISAKEEIQNEVLLIVKRYSEEKITKEEAIAEVNNLLKDRNDLDDAFKKSWIEALEDY